MWLGKISIILYLFSVGVLFGGYYIDTALGENLFQGSSYDSLIAIANRNDINESISAELIYGDFIAGVRVLFSIMTGETITDAMSSLPHFDASWLLILRVLFTLGSSFLWIYLITGRSI